MPELLQENVILLVLALVIGIAVAWWVLVANRKTTVEREEVSEEESSAAKRNQALIDAAPAAAKDETVLPPQTPDAIGGVGVAVAAGSAPEGELQAAVAPAPQQAPTSAAEETPAGGDDLGRIKGVGPKLVAKLHELGVVSYAEIAGWSEEDIDRIDVQLGRFSGRIRRDNWVEQARLLESGDAAAYAAKFGNL